jgi:tetratricopeptide (TPR) repeat protein
MKNKSLLLILILILGVFGQVIAQSKAYLKEDADNYFKAGRYWDAFFMYRDIAKLVEFQGDYQIETQIKNSSHAMYLWKKTEDFRSFKKYEIAKQNLSELILLNPYDPNRGLLPRITLEQASEMQRFALRQRTKEATNDYLAQALKLYNLALAEGLKDEMVFSLIKQCEFSLANSKNAEIKQPTSYGINYEKDKEAERVRSVEIIKN